MTTKPSSWIKSKDFIKTTFKISVKNNTTRMPVDSPVGVEVVEVNETGLVLKLPKVCGALGHLLAIQILRQEGLPTPGQAKPLPFVFTGKIIGMEPLDKIFSAITLQFYQFNEGEWRNFLSGCNDRQRGINSLIRKVQE